VRVNYTTASSTFTADVLELPERVAGRGRHSIASTCPIAHRRGGRTHFVPTCTRYSFALTSTEGRCGESRSSRHQHVVVLAATLRTGAHRRRPAHRHSDAHGHGYRNRRRLPRRPRWLFAWVPALLPPSRLCNWAKVLNNSLYAHDRRRPRHARLPPNSPFDPSNDNWGVRRRASSPDVECRPPGIDPYRQDSVFIFALSLVSAQARAFGGARLDRTRRTRLDEWVALRRPSR